MFAINYYSTILFVYQKTLIGIFHTSFLTFRWTFDKKCFTIYKVQCNEGYDTGKVIYVLLFLAYFVTISDIFLTYWFHDILSFKNIYFKIDQRLARHFVYYVPFNPPPFLCIWIISPLSHPIRKHGWDFSQLWIPYTLNLVLV